MDPVKKRRDCNCEFPKSNENEHQENCVTKLKFDKMELAAELGKRKERENNELVWIKYKLENTKLELEKLNDAFELSKNNLGKSPLIKSRG